MLRLLADNGHPLEVTLEKGDGETHLTRNSVRVPCPHWTTTETLQMQLASYPREARVNGESVERTPAPGIARATVREAQALDLSCSLDVAVEGVGNRPHHEAFNALIGGVWGRIRARSLEDMPTDTYFSPAPGGNGNYLPLRIVTLAGYMEVEADELHMLQEEGRYIEIDQDSVLMGRVRERMESMFRRTADLPETPENYPGRVYFCPRTGNKGDESRFEPVPVAVTNGTPVVVVQDDMSETQAGFLSAVQATYEEESPVVAVSDDTHWFGARKVPGAGTLIDRVRCTGVREEPENGRIMLLLETREGDVTHKVPARFWVEGDWEDELKARVAPGKTTRDELRNLMIRACWKDDEYESKNTNEWDLDLLEANLDSMAIHLLGDSRGAFRQDMQRLADRFNTLVPIPEEPLSVTSQDGRITVTLNPQANGGGEEGDDGQTA